MDIRLLLTVFMTVFIAELGDKTQIATLLYASGDKNHKGTVFLGAALALIVTSAIGVLIGSALSVYINEKVMSWLAGTGFIAVGLFTIIKTYY